MTKIKTYQPSTDFLNTTHLTAQQYHTLYQQAQTNPEQFWTEQALKFTSWFSPWTHVTQGDFTTSPPQWFTQGKLNACYNCVDRHLETRPHQIAIIYEGNSPEESITLTYAQLHEQICRFANVLKSEGVKKGARVCIYLPMIPEAIIAMLACARIGAVHSVVFAGFSAEALSMRINDADCCLLITADEGIRGDKIIPLKNNCDLALQNCPHVQRMIVVKRTGAPIAFEPARDVWYHEAMQAASSDCQPEVMDSADPLFILYTSGSTGKPKGVLHSTGGYLVYAAMTHYYVFDYQEGDIHWCTADIGWITGHSYLVYGPLLNGATTLLFEGVPHYPSYARYWEVIDKHQVNIFYTAPTAIRALRHEGDTWVQQTQRTSLKLLGTVGEPINPDVWEWYYHVVGEARCPIVNTWWQTETGGIMLTAFPGATPLEPGSVGWPFFGIEPDIIDDKGHTVENLSDGKLVIKKPWPGLMETIYGDEQRYKNYFITTHTATNYYMTGDEAHRCGENGYWINGRDDDVIKVSGHRLGTEELESALVAHPAVSEAAVVGIPDAIKGEEIYAFVTTKASVTQNTVLKAALIQQVRTKIGPLATPSAILFTAALPKTRSGKIMRRVLRKIARGDIHHLGDISTLADASVVEQIIKDKESQQ